MNHQNVADQQLAEKFAAIEALDLEMIKFKTTRIEDGYGWTREQADQVAVSYKRYLTLCLKYPHLTIAPDQNTDRFWHMHILDTQKYAQDCEAVFGYFLHHFPYLGLRGADDAQKLDDAFALTQSLYAQEFGATVGPDTQAWCAASRPAADAAWCAASIPEAKAAWCAASSPKAKAAWCAASSPEAKAAWCAASSPEAKAAWCAAASPQVMAA